MSNDRRMDDLADKRGGPPLFLIGSGVVVALIVIFIFQNTESAPVHILFWDGTAKVWVVIVISVIAGMLLDRVLQFWMGRRRRRREA